MIGRQRGKFDVGRRSNVSRHSHRPYGTDRILRFSRHYVPATFNQSLRDKVAGLLADDSADLGARTASIMRFVATLTPLRQTDLPY
jgi:hypothetical protein